MTADRLQLQFDCALADVWACGVALYTMLQGCYPFQVRGEMRLL